MSVEPTHYMDAIRSDLMPYRSFNEDNSDQAINNAVVDDSADEATVAEVCIEDTMETDDAA